MRSRSSESLSSKLSPLFYISKRVVLIMSTNKKACLQRRIVDSLREHSKWIFFLPLFVSIVAAGLFFVLPQFGYGEVNILLTITIAFFAGVQGYATYTQVRLFKERNRIEDLRNELEKAYGPLYTLLSRDISVSDELKSMWLIEECKRNLDEIVATYPFMFPSEILDLWRKEIQPVSATDGIPLEFRDKINEGYDRKVKEYYRLLERE